jgi:hypothetical protein
VGVVVGLALVAGLVVAVVGAARGFELPPHAAAATARASIAVTAAIRRSARAMRRPPPLRRCLSISPGPVSRPRGRLTIFLPFLPQPRTSGVGVVLRSVLTLAIVGTVTITCSLCHRHDTGLASLPDGRLLGLAGPEAAALRRSTPVIKFESRGWL